MHLDSDGYILMKLSLVSSHIQLVFPNYVPITTNNELISWTLSFSAIVS